MKTETQRTSSEAGSRSVPRVPVVLVQVAIPYSVLIAVLYLVGYWGAFHVNPLEYVGVSDFLRLAAYPLALLLLLSVFWFLLHEVQWVMTQSFMRWASNKPWWLLIAAYGSLAVVSVMVVLWLQSAPPEGQDHLDSTWLFALVTGVAVSALAAVALESSDAFEWISRFAIVRRLVVLAVLIPLTSAFSFGRLLGKENLKDDCAALEVDLARSGIALDKARGATYLGNLGGHIFMREWDTGAVVITRLSGGAPLVLLPREARSDDQQKACNRLTPSDGEKGERGDDSM